MRRQVNGRGFSLIEVLISMALLTVGVLGLTASHIAASKSDGHGAHLTQATAIAQSISNYVNVIPYGSSLIADSTTSCTDVDDISQFQTASPGCTADKQLSFPLTGSDALSGADGLDYNGDGVADYQVFLNVIDRCVDSTNASSWTFNCTGAKNFKQIGIIVRWKKADGTYFAVSTQTGRFNPSLFGN